MYAIRSYYAGLPEAETMSGITVDSSKVYAASRAVAWLVSRNLRMTLFFI